MLTLLQALPPEESLNPKIALWIIATLIGVIVSGFLFFKWVFREVKGLFVLGWKEVQTAHNEGMDHLETMSDILTQVNNNQIKFEQKQDIMNQQLQEIRYSQLNMAKLATEIKVRSGGVEEIISLEKELKKKKEKRRELEGA